MRRTQIQQLFHLLCIGLLLTSCSRSKDEVWDDAKSCSRYMKRGLCSLGGKQGDSRQVYSREDFVSSRGEGGSYECGFIPLEEMETSDVAMADFVARQPKESPGDPGSTVPGIEAFKDPSLNPKLAAIFQTIQFPYDSSLIKGEENIRHVAAIADYLKKNPKVYIFVEGHCDERGAEAYNLALGAKRANSVRNALIKGGVNADNVFTISYGKERPLVYGHNSDAWAQNRRAEFKVYGVR